MATLLVTPNEVIENTPLRGGTDPDYIRVAIKDAQNLSLAYVLGWDLMNKLITLSAAGTVPAPYADLLNNFVKPYLIQQAGVDVLMSLRVDVNNQGLNLNSNPQGSPLAGQDYATYYSQTLRKADGYKILLVDWLCSNSSLYPEYSTQTNGRQNKEDYGSIYGTFDNW